MKTPRIAISLTLLVATVPICAQSVSAPTNAADYEGRPELILRPEILQGPNQKVRNEVPPYSGANASRT